MLHIYLCLNNVGFTLLRKRHKQKFDLVQSEKGYKNIDYLK